MLRRGRFWGCLAVCLVLVFLAVLVPMSLTWKGDLWDLIPQDSSFVLRVHQAPLQFEAFLNSDAGEVLREAWEEDPSSGSLGELKRFYRDAESGLGPVPLPLLLQQLVGEEVIGSFHVDSDGSPQWLLVTRVGGLVRALDRVIRAARVLNSSLRTEIGSVRLEDATAFRIRTGGKEALFYHRIRDVVFLSSSAERLDQVFLPDTGGIPRWRKEGTDLEFFYQPTGILRLLGDVQEQWGDLLWDRSSEVEASEQAFVVGGLQSKLDSWELHFFLPQGDLDGSLQEGDRFPAFSRDSAFVSCWNMSSLGESWRSRILHSDGTIGEYAQDVDAWFRSQGLSGLGELLDPMGETFLFEWHDLVMDGLLPFPVVSLKGKVRDQEEAERVISCLKEGLEGAMYGLSFEERSLRGAQAFLLPGNPGPSFALQNGFLVVGTNAEAVLRTLNEQPEAPSMSCISFASIRGESAASLLTRFMGPWEEELQARGWLADFRLACRLLRALGPVDRRRMTKSDGHAVIWTIQRKESPSEE